MGRTRDRLHARSGFEAASFLSLLLLAACGGGGGGGSGGGSPSPPAPGPGDTEKFFPDAVGNAWFYDATAGDPAVPSSTEYSFGQMTVTGTKVFGSVTAKVFLSATPSDPTASIETYYYKDSDGVTNYGNNDPEDTLTRAVVPYLEGKFPVQAGVITDVRRSGVDYGQDLDGDRRNETVDFTMRITMDGFEALTVPVGSFSRTAKRTNQIDGTLRLTTGGTAPFAATETLWSAPGVGIVRQVVKVTAGGQTSQQTSEARGYKVDGTARGMGLPTSYLTGLVPADSNVYMPGPAAVASDGSRFVLATTRQTNIGTYPASTKIVAAFGDADGKLVKEVDVTASAIASMGGGMPYDIAFDGTNYLLLYSKVVSGSGPNPLMATRISPSGSVLDGTSGLQIDGGTASFAAVAYGASNYLVVYTRFNNTVSRHQLFGRLVTPAGNPGVGGEFPIGARDRNQLMPDIAFDGTNFLVTWQDAPGSGSGPIDTRVVAARVSEAGAVLDPSGLVVSDTGKGSYAPRVAFGGGRYVVVWQDLRNAGSGTSEFDIYATRIGTDGALLDGSAGSGGLRVTGGKSYNPRNPSVVYAGSEFLVTWAAGAYATLTDPCGIYGARISTAGTVSRGTGYGIALSGRPPAATYSKYEFPATVRVSGVSVVTWLDNTELSGSTKAMDALSVYSFE